MSFQSRRRPVRPVETDDEALLSVTGAPGTAGSHQGNPKRPRKGRRASDGSMSEGPLSARGAAPRPPAPFLTGFGGSATSGSLHWDSLAVRMGNATTGNGQLQGTSGTTPRDLFKFDPATFTGTEVLEGRFGPAALPPQPKSARSSRKQNSKWSNGDYKPAPSRPPPVPQYALQKQQARSSSTGRLVVPKASRLPPLQGNTAQSEAVDTAALDRPEEALGLRSGAQVVTFFGKNGMKSDIKVVFLNRAPERRGHFQPYELRVVHRNETQPEYFTMSAGGVVHVHPQRPSEFVSLGDFWEEVSMFKSLREIPFFKNFLPAKVYKKWSGNVRYMKYSAVRTRLTRRLFLGKTAFCPTLLDIGRLCADLREVPVMSVEAKRTLAIEDFSANQVSSSQSALKSFETTVENIEAMLEKVCEEVKARVARYDDGEEAVLDSLDGAARTSTTQQGRRGEKSKSMLQLKREAIERARSLQLAKQEVGMLGSFVRLIDYMVVESLITVTLTSGIDLLRLLQNPPKKLGLFSTTVSLGSSKGDVIFTPGLDDCESALANAVDEIVNLAANVSRPLYLSTFRAYFGDHAPVGPAVAETLRDSQTLSSIIAGFSQVVEQDFLKCAEYGAMFDDYRAIKDYGDTFSAEAFASQDLIANSRVIKKEMLRLKQWGQDLERMKLFNVVGILHVDSKTLRNALMGVKDGCLSEMKEVLHEAARESCQQVLSDFQTRIRVMQRKPTSLREFAQFVDAKNAVSEDVRALMSASTTVDEMYRLLTVFEVRIPAQEQVRLDDLHAIHATFLDALQQAETESSSRMPAMSAALDKNIASLNEELLGLLATLHSGDCNDETCDSKTVLSWLASVKENIDVIQEKAETYTEYQKLFRLTPYEYMNMRTAVEEYEARQTVWGQFDEFLDRSAGWRESVLSDLDPEEVQREVQQILKLATRLTKKNENDRVAAKFREEVETWRGMVPTLLDLGNPALRERHWSKIFGRLGVPVQEGISLDQLLEWRVLEHKDYVSEVSGVASGEYALELQLEKIRTGWGEAEFNCSNYREQRDVYVLAGLDDVFALLEDNQAALQTMLASRFVVGIRSEVEDWDKKLSLLSETLDEWLTCQRTWMYLEPIFSAPDIQAQLPDETIQFLRVDQHWKDLMKRTAKKKLVIECACAVGVLDMLVDDNKVLDNIQKCLEDYLTTKRDAFPRFYFLSNDELLEILSQTRDPTAVQPHLRKCFDGMAKVTFEESSDSIDMTALHSVEGEVVPLSNHVSTKGNVENWMLELEIGMRETLHGRTLGALEAYNEEGREKWFFEWPAQAVLTVDQIVWQNGVSAALANPDSAPKELQKFLDFSIEQISRMVEVVRTNLTSLQRGCMGNLIVIDVHARDVVARLVREQCSATTDFAWISQLRYYWDSSEEVNDCVVRQTNAWFLYGYEYLGVVPRLVITPLTDKCFMTLTGALNLVLGGAPAGPAGTGKTESVKDLGKALARQCVVFNCSDGLDYKMMGRFFSGLAQAGAWACFDEFNRIDIEVLSVIAQQILTIQQALKAEQERFMFEGRDIALSKNYGCFITMNPGYAGRTELPDNLKALFRPMAMMVPDYALIAEIMLFSEGFGAAKDLARKMAAMYRLASEQLSSQDHYDFGMRAVKSVLVMAGSLKRSQPDVAEDVTLIRAMRDSNVPKFLADDIPLFLAIVRDLFPGVEVPIVDVGDLKTEIEAQLVQAKLQVVDPFVGKIVQLFETMNVRHGVMLVGVTSTGKTTAATTLANSLTTLNQKAVQNGVEPEHLAVQRFTLNPKSITMGELYGEFNLQTNEWTDGLIATIVRQGVAATDEARKWVICDGPVDAIWIESMNTVLDDNKTLCLNNGERIKLPKTMSMMFEVNDLAVASPATVSRCGMVYLEPVYLGWKPYAQSWAESVIDARHAGKGIGASLLKLMDNTVEDCLTFLRTNCKEHMPVDDVPRVHGLCKLIDAMLPAPQEGEEATTSSPLDHLEAVFGFALAWAMGGNLVESSIPKFDGHLRAILAGLGVPMPESGTAFDYRLDPFTWRPTPWEQTVPAFKYEASKPFFDLVVPTVDTTRTQFLLKIMVEAKHHVLIGGNSGVGKTVAAQSYLSQAGESLVWSTKLFSAQTSAANLQAFLEEKLEKLRKNLLGPPSGKQMVFFVDDLNMPQKETYGAQPPIELLRQIINNEDDKQGGFYDRKKVGLFKKVKDTLFLAACAPPSGGRSSVTQRLMRHFLLINLPDLSQSSMQKIFQGILDGFLSQGGFPGDVVALSESMVEASIAIYSNILKELLPTPARSHYTFNLRDLSKVVQGMLMAEPKQLPNGDQALRLWVHEASRVFRDRLVNDDDRAWFDGAVQEQLASAFNRQWPIESFNRVVWGSFLNPTDGSYVEIEDMEHASKVLQDFAEDYTLTTNKPMNLVFFRDAIEHVARVSRILRQPRGNALLVGVGGSGRQSLARLASHIAEASLYQIELTRTYGTVDFHEDLKKLLMAAGCKDRPTTFLFSDTQLVRESFLEDINNLLNAGEVPDLFARDEIDAIVEQVRPKAKAAGKLETRDGIFQHFVHLVRENLHVVLAMSPVGDEFRTRLRMFPSLVNTCTIDWYTEWPNEALTSVAAKFVRDAGLEQSSQDSVCQVCMEIHSSVSLASVKFASQLRRHNYTTPTSYLELINLYMAMLKEQREKNLERIHRYQGGVDKLMSTNDVVEQLKAELQKLKPVLVQAASDTEELLSQVDKDKAEAEKVRTVVEEEAARVNAVTAEAKEIKDDAQKDLDEALPAFESAVQSLRALNKNDITEIKSFAKPPPLVQTVMEGVCLLKGEKTDWDTAKKVLADGKFMDSLMNYDKDNIPDRTIKKLQVYIKNPDFVPETVEKVSKAAKSLCMWVRAMDTYARVAKNVEPKRQRLREAETKVAEMSKLLAAKQAELAEVQAKVASLEEKLSETMRQRDDLQQQSDDTTTKLTRAEQLISGLGGEKVRWEAELDQLQEDRVNLVGNVLVAAGCIAYGGPFTATYRHDLVQGWIKKCVSEKLPVDANFNFQRIVGDAVQMREWGIQGLPQDDLSLDNGIIMTRGRRWPLLIDPQMQANRWIRNMERPNHLQVIKLTEATYLRTLENCIRVGNPVLLENVEEKLDPALEPVLLKQVFKQSGRLLIRLGDTDVDYSPEFKFYITSKLPNPHYQPEVQVKVTLVNFTVTPKGLEDQLLSQVVGFERPELEEEKGRLVMQIADGRRELSEIEDKILYMLANSTGNILDDEVLIATLAASKTTSEQVNVQVAQAEETKLKIDEACEGYRPVATRGSILYFVVADMGGVDPMYQYSLQYFIKLFGICMEKTEKSDELQTRVSAMKHVMTSDIYANICRGLFEKDKRMYSLLIAVQILRNQGTISDAEWSFFLTRGGLIDTDHLPENPASSWLKADSWGALLKLSELPAFTNLDSAFKDDQEGFRKWSRDPDAITAELPPSFSQPLSTFQRLLLIRVLAGDMLVSSATNFILVELGKHFVQSPPFDLKTSFADSSNTTPIIFVLSPGADPMSYLLALADEMGMRDRLRMISLGQGQGPIAQKMIESARDAGEWVCLQNCHLAASWMPDLERLLEAQNTMKLHDDFRLWLTSMPSKAFPVSVLQNGIKLTDEPPKGLRANVKRTFEDMTDKQFMACSKSLPWHKLLFGLAFFHAAVQERRKFGPIGWNIPYEWNNSDLLTAMANLRMYIEDQEEVPYQTLQYVVGEVNYGGRVTDYWDQRCVRCILNQYFNPDALDDNYKFTSDGSYHAPKAGSSLDEVRAFIEDFPLSDSPEVYGLHSNAAITFDHKEASYLVDTIISVQPRTGGTGGADSSDIVVLRLAADILSKLPALLSKDGASEVTFALEGDSGAMNSLGTFLSIEIGKFNRLLSLVRSSLAELQRAIKGLVVMSSDLEGVYSALLLGRVPSVWANAGYLSQKPLGSWVKDLCARVAFVQNWLVNGPPACFWMSAFFFPQGFMTAALQTYARKHSIAIDTLDFRTVMTKIDSSSEITEAPESGVYIDGLYVEGAIWDSESMSLQEARPSELYSPMPVILLEPEVAKHREATTVDTPGYYIAPLYKVSSRAGTLSTTGHSTNYIRTLDIPSQLSAEHWVRRGVALLSQLDD